MQTQGPAVLFNNLSTLIVRLRGLNTFQQRPSAPFSLNLSTDQPDTLLITGGLTQTHTLAASFRAAFS